MSPLGGLAAQAQWLLIGSRGQSLPLNLNFNKRQQLLNSIRWISRNCTVSISSARRSSGAFNRKFTETDSQQLESPDRINSAHNICTSGKSSDERHINQLVGLKKIANLDAVQVEKIHRSAEQCQPESQRIGVKILSLRHRLVSGWKREKSSDSPHRTSGR